MDNNILMLFNSIRKKMYKIVNDKIKEYDISFIESIYLIIINKYKKITFKDLTKEADCDKGMTTKVLCSLCLKGLVIKDIKYIRVTAKGKKLSNKLNDVLNSIKLNIINNVGEKELLDFKNKLNKFNKMLEGEIKC